MSLQANSAAVVCATVALLIGVLCYLFVRPEAAVFVPASLHRPQAVGAALTMLGYWLPTLCHVIGLSLATALVAGLSTRTVIGAAAFWGVVNLLCELGQHPSVRAALPDFLIGGRDISGSGLVEHYFTQGRFDIADLTAAVAGAWMAASIGCSLAQRRRQETA